MKYLLSLLLLFSTTITFARAKEHKEITKTAKQKTEATTYQKDCQRTVTQVRSASYTCNGVDITVTASATRSSTQPDCDTATAVATIEAASVASQAAHDAAVAGAASCQQEV